MIKKTLKIIYWIFLFLLVRYLLYDLNILKVTSIDYKNNKIYLKHIKKIDLITDNGNFLLIEPSFIAIYDSINLNFLLKIFEPQKIIITAEDNLVIFYSITSKEYDMFSNSLTVDRQLKSDIVKNNKECKIYKDNSIDSYLIYDKNGLFILRGKNLDINSQKFCFPLPSLYNQKPLKKQSIIKL